jgi:hypothetical protein
MFFGKKGTFFSASKDGLRDARYTCTFNSSTKAFLFQFWKDLAKLGHFHVTNFFLIVKIDQAKNRQTLTRYGL